MSTSPHRSSSLPTLTQDHPSKKLYHAQAVQQNSCPLPVTSSCHRLLRSEEEASFEPEGSLGNIHLFWSCGCRVPRSPSAECAHHAHSWGELQDLSKGQHLGNRLLLADAASASQTPCAWEAVGKRPGSLHPPPRCVHCSAKPGKGWELQ